MTTTDISTEPLVYLEYDEAVDLLNRAVAEKGPDYVYRSEVDLGLCVYFEAGGPSCIVGHLLDYRGISQEQVGGHNEDGIDCLVQGNVLGADAKTQGLLEIAQSQQDNGERWGDAVAMAIWCAENDTKPFEYHLHRLERALA